MLKAPLTSRQLEAIRAELRRVADQNDVHTSGWIPGTDLSGTVNELIYSHLPMAAISTRRLLFFGLIVRDAFIKQTSGRSSLQSPAAQQVYFKVKR